MKTSVQNIFMDCASYELISKEMDLRELVDFIKKNVAIPFDHPVSDIVKLPSISIGRVVFEVDYRPKKPLLGAVINTIKSNHTVVPDDNFTRSLFLYNEEALNSCEEITFGIVPTLLLYTRKHAISVVTNDNRLAYMRWSSGELVYID